jgi:tRNA(Ile)-lysidine synthase TilS/MesJ
MLKENINMEISSNTNQNPIIKLENTDDLDQDNPCSLSENDLSIKPNSKKIMNKSICYKCKVNKSNYFNRNEFVCRECFMWMINHKFRSNLRVHCRIRHEDYVLVCISGGINSMAMLNLFNASFNDNQSKRKLFFKLKVLYIDDSILMLDKNAKIEEVEIERQNKRILITNLCDKFGFAVEVINLESGYNADNINVSERFLNIYKSLPKVGSFKEDFIKITTRNLIFQYTLTNNFTKIIFANSAQGIVNSIFNTIVKGRGYSVREDTGYIDSHFLNGKITILRPMKDFITKEILIYNYITNNELIYSTSDLILIRTPINANTNLLLKQFFDKLQDRMGSTITTVLGTADKLKLKNNSFGGICEFCLNYLDEVYNELEICSIDTIINE